MKEKERININLLESAVDVGTGFLWLNIFLFAAVMCKTLAPPCRILLSPWLQSLNKKKSVWACAFLHLTC